MFPASSKGGGSVAIPGPLDTCKTPSPGGPVPIPYPNLAQVAQANSVSEKVKIENMGACTMKSEIPMSSGDEGGTAGGGMISSKFKGEVKYKKGSTKVKVEGEDIVFLTSMTGHNGSNANMPSGVQVAPSQTKVIIGS